MRVSGCRDLNALISSIILLALCAGCSAGVPVRTGFDGARAYADLAAIVDIGPRTAGSAGSARTRDYIREQVEAAGHRLREYPFVARTPRGKISMTNLVVEIPGSRPGIVIIGNHYDTKYFPDFTFVGANDGGSTTAWMIEMARAIGPKREGCTLWLCWFDGEEALEEWTDTDSLYGSRQMVVQLRADGRLKDVRAMINVDMIGDCDLGILKDQGAPPWMIDAVWSAASDVRRRRAFLPQSIEIEDDHLPFRKAGVPAMNLIDFRYGGAMVEHQMNWHTTRDRIDLVCAESLQTMGDVILTALPRLEASLPGAETTE